MTRIVFTVRGTPIPQGSMRHHRTPDGKTRLHHSNKDLNDWREKTRLTALAAARTGAVPTPIDAPVELTILFRMPRPKTSRDELPMRKPDLDKLVRAIGDALSPRNGMKVLAEDSRIVRIRAEEIWATPSNPPGATITITTIAKENE